MKTSQISLLFVLATLGLAPGLALAGDATRAFVSRTGSDIPACGPELSPCRTFQYAHDNILSASAGGEINVEDVADYGPIAINRPLTINGNSMGSIQTTSAGNAITTNQTSHSVLLRNLFLVGAGVGSVGISYVGGNSLTVENCVIRGFLSDAIQVTAPNSTLLVQSSTATGNGGNGVLVAPTGGVASVQLNNFFSERNNNGVYADGTKGASSINVKMDSSLAQRNGHNGFVGTGQTVSLFAQSSTANGNLNSGFRVINNATIYLNSSAASGNQNYGVNAGTDHNGGALGIVYTYGNNAIINNVSGDVNGSLTKITHE